MEEERTEVRKETTENARKQNLKELLQSKGMLGLKNYLWNEWRNNNSSKYYNYFEEWYLGLTCNQIDYFIAYMMGKKSPLTL